MNFMKVAISVPDPVFEAGEYLARQLKVSRSQLYSDALAAHLSYDDGSFGESHASSQGGAKSSTPKPHRAAARFKA